MAEKIVCMFWGSWQAPAAAEAALPEGLERPERPERPEINEA